MILALVSSCSLIRHTKEELEWTFLIHYKELMAEEGFGKLDQSRSRTVTLILQPLNWNFVAHGKMSHLC